jgi:hypothetical protein
MLGKDSFFFGPPCQWGRGPDELSRVSEMFRPVAARLLAVPPEGRQRVWDDFLAGRLQPSPIIEAVHELEPPTAASSLERAVPDPPRPTPNHHGENAAEPERRLRLTCAVNLAPREVEWLWAGPAKDASFPPAVEVPSASSLKNSASAAYAEFPVRDAQNQVPDGE